MTLPMAATDVGREMLVMVARGVGAASGLVRSSKR